MSKFSFHIKYIPGDVNTFADALSRMYSNEPTGIVCAESEYIHEVDAPSIPVSVLEPVKLLVFGMHTQSPKSFYRDVTNKKRNLILCCSTTPEII